MKLAKRINKSFIQTKVNSLSILIQIKILYFKQLAES
jgi:hypothetical protein